MGHSIQTAEIAARRWPESILTGRSMHSDLSVPPGEVLGSVRCDSSFYPGISRCNSSVVILRCIGPWVLIETGFRTCRDRAFPETRKLLDRTFDKRQEPTIRPVACCLPTSITAANLRCFQRLSRFLRTPCVLVLIILRTLRRRSPMSAPFQSTPGCTRKTVPN